MDEYHLPGKDQGGEIQFHLQSGDVVRLGWEGMYIGRAGYGLAPALEAKILGFLCYILRAPFLESSTSIQ